MNVLKIKSLFSALAIILSLNSVAQTAKKEVPKGWHLLDPKTDGFEGVSTKQAYEFLKQKGKTGKKVIVAVIDSGIDTAHEDLKPVLWVNTKEIPGNGKDDDNNGYIDDINGWNFLGGKDGQNVGKDSYEAARVYWNYKSRFENLKSSDGLSKDDKFLFEQWKNAKKEILGDGKPGNVKELKENYSMVEMADEFLRKEMKKEVYTGNELEQYTPKSNQTKQAKELMLYLFKANNLMSSTNQDFIKDFKDYVDAQVAKEESRTKAPENYRLNIVKDDEADWNTTGYGNNDLMANTPKHGTHCSGIIAALRNNGKGGDGMADNALIMTLRAVPDGDEHDKDIAKAIRYAVDNGARIISMSFGKSYSPFKKWVDDAMKYAESKNVLLVHGAGNDSKDVDVNNNFPNGNYLDGGSCKTLITVGSSADPNIKSQRISDFSNFGIKSVDVFAPGHQIYNALPGGNQYGDLSGTSMACPLVSGIAATLMSYYPHLTAIEVKEIIEKTAIKPQYKVNKPGSEDGELVELSDLCKTGGIVNAFEAVKMADSYVSAKPSNTENKNNTTATSSVKKEEKKEVKIEEKTETKKTVKKVVKKKPVKKK